MSASDLIIGTLATVFALIVLAIIIVVKLAFVVGMAAAVVFGAYLAADFLGLLTLIGL